MYRVKKIALNTFYMNKLTESIVFAYTCKVNTLHNSTYNPANAITLRMSGLEWIARIPYISIYSYTYNSIMNIFAQL